MGECCEFLEFMSACSGELWVSVLNKKTVIFNQWGCSSRMMLQKKDIELKIQCVSERAIMKLTAKMGLL